jgi:trans-aconitate 2-methyltransferase
VSIKFLDIELLDRPWLTKYLDVKILWETKERGAMVTWDPAVYLDFAAERGRPFTDLLARVGAERPASVVDLGCGPGGLTASLAERWPGARVLGLDSSPEMVGRAASYSVPGRVEFELGDVRSWQPAEPVDVIVTNATLQWVPGHLELLPVWVSSALRPGGWLALQVPGNLSDPLHSLLRDLARSPRWFDRLAAAEDVRAVVPDPIGYDEVLAGAGCVVDAWETTYLHVLDPEGHLGADAVLAWAKGTALRPVLDALGDNDSREEFLGEYGELLHAAYPRRPWGTPLPFRRIFAVAHKPAAS